MSQPKMTWNGKRLTAEVRAVMVKRLRLAAELLDSQVKRNISEPQPPSEPGGFPHADTGRLRNSITHEVDEKQLRARVAAPVEYAAFLEHGTSSMDARPFLERTLREMKPRLRAILTMPEN